MLGAESTPSSESMFEMSIDSMSEMPEVSFEMMNVPQPLKSASPKLRRIELTKRIIGPVNVPVSLLSVSVHGK